jgi:hypothetical protein
MALQFVNVLDCQNHIYNVAGFKTVKEALDDLVQNSGVKDYLLSDGSIDMDTGYVPVNDLSVATKKYVIDSVGSMIDDSNSSGTTTYSSSKINSIVSTSVDVALLKDGTSELDSGYVPTLDMHVANKKFVHDVADAKVDDSDATSTTEAFSAYKVSELINNSGTNYLKRDGSSTLDDGSGSYTPTSNYQVANKKYVDDEIIDSSKSVLYTLGEETANPSGGDDVTTWTTSVQKKKFDEINDRAIRKDGSVEFEAGYDPDAGSDYCAITKGYMKSYVGSVTYALSDLTDVPSYSASDAGKVMTVVDDTNVSFSFVSFLGLSDTPADYTNHANERLTVDSVSNSIIFIEDTMSNLKDVASYNINNAGQAPIVSSAGDAIIWSDINDINEIGDY